MNLLSGSALHLDIQSKALRWWLPLFKARSADLFEPHKHHLCMSKACQGQSVTYFAREDLAKKIWIYIIYLDGRLAATNTMARPSIETSVWLYDCSVDLELVQILSGAIF